ncbi:MAG TPA: hypothetical protein VFS43_36630 [Polyangiaceae bacterium]|nr:hypothetical protein [Polyangiaceae bacterium]
MNTARSGRWLGAAALALLGLGCGHTETRAVAFDPSGQRTGEVTVYDARAAPVGGQDLGTVTVRGGEGVDDNDVRKLYSELVRQAKARGGNAVVIESIETGAKGEAAAPSRAKTMPPCAPDCPDGLSDGGEVMRVEMRGKVLRVPPDEPKWPQPDHERMP